MSSSAKLELSGLQEIIKRTLDNQLDISYWVVAEINELKVNANGHCYLELVEKNADSQFLKAKMSATIWSSTFGMLCSYFSMSTGRQLQAGLRVLVKASVQYHVLYGMSLNITDIEPSFTVGELYMQRQKTIQRLKADGVFEMNQEQHLPLLPRRIAVISSEKAAGYQDFMRHLMHNEYGYTFSVTLFSAAMQGNAAEDSIINAIHQINSQTDRFDAVVVIRGGGSQSDLSCFDSYNLCYHAAQFPLPLLTGIGHDKDLSVLDMVAYQHLKTPTAVADFLIANLASIEAQLDAWTANLKTLSSSFVADEGSKIMRISNLLHSNAVASLAREKSKLNDWLPSRLKSAVKHGLSVQEQRLKINELKVQGNNPQEMLDRGYSMTLYKDRPIKSADEVRSGDLIETVFSNSRLRSIVSKDRS